MAAFKSDGSAGRIAKNGLFTGLRFCAYTVAGIFFIPFLVKHYGSESYGLIALAGFLTQYVGMISGCIGSAVGRYLNVALNQDDWKQANEIYSTALLANVSLILLQLPVYVLGIWKIDWLMDVSPAILNDFRILVSCNVAIFMLTTISGIFYTPIHAANRLDISAKIGTFRQLVRIGLLVSLVLGFGAKLWIIGAVDLVLSLIEAGLAYSFFRKFADRLKFSLKSVTRKWIKPVLDMAGWSLLSLLGFSLFVKTDIWMINRFVNKDMAGIYAALLVWPNLFKQVGGMFGSLFGPVFTIDFAKGNMERIRKSCLVSCEILSFGTAYVGGVFVVLAPELIQFWLKADYSDYVIWVQLMVGQLVFTISGSIVWHIFVAVGRTKYMGIGNLIPGMVNIAVSLLLIKMGYGALGVLWGTIIAVFLKENVLFPLWVSKEINLPYWRFLTMYIKSGLIFGAVLLFGTWCFRQGTDFSVLRLMLTAAVQGGVALVMIYAVTKREDREMMLSFVKNKMTRGTTPS